MWFPVQTADATLIATVWEIDFPTSNHAQQLQWIALQGPANSNVMVYLNTIFIDTTPRGDFNRADYPVGMPIAAGQQLRLVWNVGTGNAPKASIGCTDGGVQAQQSLGGNGSLIGS